MNPLKKNQLNLFFFLSCFIFIGALIKIVGVRNLGKLSSLSLCIRPCCCEAQTTVHAHLVAPSV